MHKYEAAMRKLIWSSRDAQAVKDLNDKLKEEMHRLGVDVVNNADQTPACFEHVPKVTIDKKVVPIVWVRTNGKLKSFIVLKTSPSKIPEMRKQNYEHRRGFGKHLWKEISRLQD
ncbi:hypothetical protein BBJ28_00014323 [Nothophytophthora sp. Chile5]|nr:hypothetical protein BBJ28_00014323 [Nothophytophthora sp. Chile5]